MNVVQFPEPDLFGSLDIPPEPQNRNERNHFSFARAFVAQHPEDRRFDSTIAARGESPETS